MKITIFAGKGGVGKSTAAAAYAVNKATHRQVLAVDYDGGHSLTRVLSIDRANETNIILPTGINNLDMAVIDPLQFEPIREIKRKGREISDYLSQFKGDYGLIPFCDMVTTFFGAPTDIISVSRYASLIDLYHKSKELGIDNLVIDVEPTAGLHRMLDSNDSIVRSLTNLKNPPLIARLSRAPMFLQWPDIGSYVHGDFVQNAKVYTQRLMETSENLKNAGFFVVCIPESSPVDEMEDVREVIASFGGNVIGHIINNIRGELHEKVQIKKVIKKAGNLPVVKIDHDIRLCDSNSKKRYEALENVGSLF
jgi:anion-transporting  ArsA/GET3 family ATPase